MAPCLTSISGSTFNLWVASGSTLSPTLDESGPPSPRFPSGFDCNKTGKYKSNVPHARKGKWHHCLTSISGSTFNLWVASGSTLSPTLDESGPLSPRFPLGFDCNKTGKYYEQRPACEKTCMWGHLFLTSISGSTSNLWVASGSTLSPTLDESGPPSPGFLSAFDCEKTGK